MENELYCYEPYRGYDIFVTCYVSDCNASGETEVQYCGSVYKDGMEFDLGNRFTALSGFICLSECIDWIDCELE